MRMKRMTQKLMSLFLALIMIVGMIPGELFPEVQALSNGFNLATDEPTEEQ